MGATTRAISPTDGWACASKRRSGASPGQLWDGVLADNGASVSITLFTEKVAQILVNSSIWFHLVPSAGSSAWPNRRSSPLCAMPSASVFCANSVSRRGDREWEIFDGIRGAVSGEEAFFRVGCQRSVCSCREAEMVGRGGEDSRQRAKKRATPGDCSLGVARQLVCRTFRCRSQGSPVVTLIGAP